MSYEHLSLEERHYIEVELRNGSSMNEIAKSLNRSQSTISREVLIKSLELLRDFKGADSRRALQAMASPCQKAQQRSCPLKAPPEGG